MTGRAAAGEYIEGIRELIGTRRLLVVAATAIIVDADERVLLQRRADNGDWNPPGGLMEPGETVTQCARREVEEETSLVLGGIDLFGVYSGTRYFGSYPNGDQFASVIIVFTCNDWEGTPTPDAESLELEWFSRGTLPENVDQHHVEYLTDFWRDTPRVL